MRLLLMIPVLALLPLALAIQASAGPMSPRADQIQQLKKDIAMIEVQLREQKNELRGWQNLNTASGWASIGRSPGPFTHLTPGADPTNVGTWRDPVSQGNAFETAIEASENINRLEPEVEYTENHLQSLRNKLAELESAPETPTPISPRNDEGFPKEPENKISGGTWVYGSDDGGNGGGGGY